MATSLKSERSQNIGTAPVAVGGYTAPGPATGVVSTNLTISNVLNGPSVVVTAYIQSNTAVITHLVQNALILQGGAIVVGKGVVLNSGDQVFVISNMVAGVDAILNVAEIS